MRTILFVLLAGCTSSNPDVSLEYLGTWSFSSGTENVSCPNGTTSDALKGNFSIQKSAAGLVVLDDEGCNFGYAVDERAATTRNQSCSFAVPQLGQGVTADVTYDLITLTTGDGQTMTDTFNGKVTYKTPSGDLDCIFSGSATLSKVQAH